MSMLLPLCVVCACARDCVCVSASSSPSQSYVYARRLALVRALVYSTAFQRSGLPRGSASSAERHVASRASRWFRCGEEFARNAFLLRTILAGKLGRLRWHAQQLRNVRYMAVAVVSLLVGGGVVARVDSCKRAFRSPCARFTVVAVLVLCLLSSLLC